MKKLFGLLIVWYAGLISPVLAQRIRPDDVRKILVTTSTGYMSGGELIEIEVTRQSGQWKSFQVNKNYFSADYGAKNEYSHKRVFITALTLAQIAGFLNSIALIKPQYDLKTFNLTAEKLIASLRKNAEKRAHEVPKLEALINKASLQQALAAIIKDETILDVGMHCDIRVVKNNGDSLKMETNHMYATMLPWRINGRDTYDMNINRFLIAAMEKMDYPNKQALDAGYLKDRIYRYIDERNNAYPISSYRWENDYPDNIALLQKTYTPIRKINIGGTLYRCQLQSKGMLSNMIMEATINTGDRAGIQQLIDFNSRITARLQTDNFILQYARNHSDFKIYFSFPDRSNSEYIAWKRKIPYLQSVDSTQVLEFNTALANDSANWLLLPGHKLVLISHFNVSPEGIAAPIFLQADSTRAKQLLNARKPIIFNPDGSLFQ